MSVSVRLERTLSMTGSLFGHSNDCWEFMKMHINTDSLRLNTKSQKDSRFLMSLTRDKSGQIALQSEKLEIREAVAPVGLLEQQKQ